MILVNCVCFVSVFLVISDSYKILLIFPNTGKSHTILSDGYVSILLEAGHEVTLITPYPKENPAPNLTQIDVSANLKFHFGEHITLDKMIDGKTLNKYKAFSIFYNIARSTVENENVQRLLNDPEQHFDLIIAEWLLSEFYAGFSAVFDCSYIWVVSEDPSWQALRLVEAVRNPEYYPDLQSGNSPPFSHVTRLLEFTHQLEVLAMKQFTFDRLERQLYEDNIVPILRSRGRSVPDFEELVFNASLVILNSHETTARMMALPLNCVTVGGFHIGPKIPPLPEDLQRLMDQATQGVIYFSMGTSVSSDTFPKHVIQSLLEMFKGLKQLVLWKLSNRVPDLPNNVHILPWAPQQSILHHQNCVLFITHGGHLSMTEAVHFGVPLVAIPVFADQFANAAKLQLKEISKTVYLTHNLVEDLKTAIEEVTGNPRFREKMEQLSLIYHDQQSPRRRLVDWVEYVARTQGAVHLRPPSALMPWYEQVYIDLLLLIIVVITVLLRVTMMLLQYIIYVVNI